MPLIASRQMPRRSSSISSASAPSANGSSARPCRRSPFAGSTTSARPASASAPVVSALSSGSRSCGGALSLFRIERHRRQHLGALQVGPFEPGRDTERHRQHEQPFQEPLQGCVVRAPPVRHLDPPLRIGQQHREAIEVKRPANVLGRERVGIGFDLLHLDDPEDAQRFERRQARVFEMAHDDPVEQPPRQLLDDPARGDERRVEPLRRCACPRPPGCWRPAPPQPRARPSGGRPPRDPAPPLRARR